MSAFFDSLYWVIAIRFQANEYVPDQGAIHNYDSELDVNMQIYNSSITLG
jgi:hypothetical protein